MEHLPKCSLGQRLFLFSNRIQNSPLFIFDRSAYIYKHYKNYVTAKHFSVSVFDFRVRRFLFNLGTHFSVNDDYHLNQLKHESPKLFCFFFLFSPSLFDKSTLGIERGPWMCTRWLKRPCTMNLLRWKRER